MKTTPVVDDPVIIAMRNTLVHLSVTSMSLYDSLVEHGVVDEAEIEARKQKYLDAMDEANALEGK